jgi:fatty acid desaturase
MRIKMKNWLEAFAITGGITLSILLILWAIILAPVLVVGLAFGLLFLFVTWIVKTDIDRADRYR